MNDLSKQLYNFLKQKNSFRNFLSEGTKVKLKYDEIIDECKRSRKNQKYLSFIEEHKNQVFTVEYDEFRSDRPDMVCLKEDATKPKWLFSIDDLQIVREE